MTESDDLIAQLEEADTAVVASLRELANLQGERAAFEERVRAAQQRVNAARSTRDRIEARLSGEPVAAKPSPGPAAGRRGARQAAQRTAEVAAVG
ncbi:MAG TPA: hypothetical protein VH208_02545 [Myxococcaceae bacterium]|nr:hypothetical protein [Myxococcaceae bacterium]